MSSTHSVLARAHQLLGQARTLEEGRAALAHALNGEDPSSEAARFLVHRGHLILRGGPRTLVREALSATDEGIRAFGEALAATLEPPLRLYRCASTRAADDGRLRTVETGARNTAAVQLSADGERLYAFVSGRMWALGVMEEVIEPLPATPPVPVAPRRPGAARLQLWRTATGERLAQVHLGDSFIGSGCLAVSSEERTLAVGRDNDVDIYSLPEREGWARGEVPRHLHRLACGQRPSQLLFLDERRLLVNSLHGELALWDVPTGARLATTPSTGTCAIIGDGAQLVMGGFPPELGATVSLYTLPGLERAGDCLGGDGEMIGGDDLAVSLDQRWLATVDTRYQRDASGKRLIESAQYLVYLWSTSELRQAFAERSPGAPARLQPRHLATFRERVSCLRFASEHQLLIGHNDGTITAWPLTADGERAARSLSCHDLIVTDIAVHPRGPLAVSAGHDNRLVFLDLAGHGQSPLRRLPLALYPTELRRHALGIEIVSASAPAALVPLPAELELEAPLPDEAQPELALAPGERFGFVDVDDPPRIALGQDLVELEAPCGRPLALDSRTFAVLLDHRIELYRLR